MNLIIEIEEQSESGFVVHARIPYARIKKSEFMDRGYHLIKKRYIGELDFLIEGPQDKMFGYARSCYSFVALSYRNRGIATQMYFAALAYMKARKLKGIYSMPSMRISNESDSVWKKLKTGTKDGMDLFHKM
jgi:hypothetical protein